MEQQRVVLKRSGKRPLQFEGELLASFETSPDRAYSNWSGSAGRWEEVRVYRARSGRYVLWHARLTQWEGERDHYQAHTFDSPDDLIIQLEDEAPRAAAEIASALGVYETV